MKACIICGCTDNNACRIGKDGACSWFDQAAPVCSRCADNTEALLERLEDAPSSAAQLLEQLVRERRAADPNVSDQAIFIMSEETVRALMYAANVDALRIADGDVLRVPPRAGALQFVGEVAGCEVYSPGTFTAGAGWGPVRSDLAAAVTGTVTEPSIVVPFYPSLKEPT